MDKKTRHDTLLRLTRAAGGYAEVADLAERTGASPVTIRRDAIELSAAGLVSRTHGGIRLIERETLTLEPSFLQRSTVAQPAKEAIARTAASLVDPGSTIAIDTGTTTLALTTALREVEDLTIVTTSLVVATTCAEHHRVHMLAGQVRPGELSVIGPLTSDCLKNFQIDLAFLGVAGITDVCADYSFEDAQVKRAMINRSARSVVLADHNKFEQRAAAVICPVSHIDVLITDTTPPTECPLDDVELMVTNPPKE